MQRRLDIAKESQANLEAQLAELKIAVDAEKASRPETVSIVFFQIQHRIQLSRREKGSRRRNSFQPLRKNWQH
jgi:hypothetical protein